MKLIDANVLVHTADRGSTRHAMSVDWLDAALNGRETVAFAWLSLIAYLRITTHPAIFTAPNSPTEAVGEVKRWLMQPAATVLEPGPRHPALMQSCLEGSGGAGDLVNDAHLAALALEHGADIVSFDHDFARFDGITWIKPGR